MKKVLVAFVSILAVVYEDFVLDRSFGYLITDRYDTVLLTGVVNNI